MVRLWKEMEYTGYQGQGDSDSYGEELGRLMEYPKNHPEPMQPTMGMAQRAPLGAVGPAVVQAVVQAVVVEPDCSLFI
ncbi:uncharacterized protein DS421_9g280580 [Arachis hypogaea]|nr:uncharacterized protein DS421_9g280580 [Arachis hypogaea]